MVTGVKHSNLLHKNVNYTGKSFVCLSRENVKPPPNQIQPWQVICTEECVLTKLFYENITIILREYITCRKLDRNFKHIFGSESMAFEDMIINTCKKVYKYRPRDNNVIIILQMNVIVM